jgi:molybdopterin synthase sulfur carrier subunit
VQRPAARLRPLRGERGRGLPTEGMPFAGVSLMGAVAAVAVDLVYLARLREAFGMTTERVELPSGVATVGDLRALLVARGGVWALELAPARAIRVAVNHALAEPGAPLRTGDEVALFPPVTGG